jgi:hypothetical protein
MLNFPEGGRFLNGGVQLPNGFVGLDDSMSFGEEDGGRVVALENDSGHDLLLVRVGLQGFGEVVGMDESDEDLQEFHHDPVGEYLHDFCV